MIIWRLLMVAIAKLVCTVVNKLDEAYLLKMLSLSWLSKRTGVFMLVDFTCRFHFFLVVSGGCAFKVIAVLRSWDAEACALTYPFCVSAPYLVDSLINAWINGMLMQMLDTELILRRNKFQAYYSNHLHVIPFLQLWTWVQCCLNKFRLTMTFANEFEYACHHWPHYKTKVDGGRAVIYFNLLLYSLGNAPLLPFPTTPSTGQFLIKCISCRSMTKVCSPREVFPTQLRQNNFCLKLDKICLLASKILCSSAIYEALRRNSRSLSLIFTR